ncbi:MAG: hypothetical protein QXL64_06035 [Thermofilaceae archaeon]
MGIYECLTRVGRTLDKLTLDIEEAREVLGFRLRGMGVIVELTRLELPGFEINLYGASYDVCVIGEATVRLSKEGVEELVRKVKDLEVLYPNLLRPRRVLAIYTSLATSDALKEAEENGVWELKATDDLTHRPKL